MIICFLIMKQIYHSMDASNDFAYKYGVRPYRQALKGIDNQWIINL